MIMKKTALFFLTGGIGGAERMTITIGEMLPKNQYNVVYVIVGRKKEIYKILPNKCRVKCLNVRNIWCFTILRMIHLILKEHADVVFSSVMYLNIRVLIAAKLTNTKAIVRNDNYLSIVSKRQLFFLRKTYPYASYVIAQQDEMYYDLVNNLNLNPQKVVIRYNPINTDRIDALIKESSPYHNNNSYKYVWIGNYIKNKGFDILIEAFGLVVREFPNSELYVLGNIDETNLFIQESLHYAKINNFYDKIHIVGVQMNPYKWIKHCDCFVLASRLEGLPNALIEAMYLKKPVAATSCIPIIDRIIDNGVNGYTAKPECPLELSAAMINAISLSNCRMTYRPSATEDFIELFK